MRLAKELDISDVGLKKACTRYGIPTPPRGYWAQLAAGTAPPKPGLRPAKIETVVLEAARHRIDVPESARAAVDTAAIKQSLSPAQSAPEPAPVAAATGEVLANARPSSTGFVSCGSSRVVRCQLSPGTVTRAASILGQIERALPSIGGRLVHDREKKCVELEVAGERLSLRIEEVTTRSIVDSKDAKPAWGHSQEFVYNFSGDLRLVVSGDYHGRGSWADGKRARLEEKLPNFLAGLVAAAHAQRQLREDREAQRRHWAEQARLREIAEARQRRMKYFVEHLAKEAAAWREYGEVKAYVDHITSQVRPGEVLPHESRMWLKLAAHLTRLTDPTKARMGRLRRGIQGYEWDLPFGRPLCGY